MVLVRATTLDDWQAMRDIRLEALRDAPDAFASTYARESIFEPAEWHRRATRDGSFLAFIPGLAEPAGLVGGFEQEPGVAEVVSMFVRPQARGHGVGEALIDAVAAWAQNRSATSVHLWVSETNKPAIRLYERCGFTVTPERQPLPSDPALGEVGMTRPLSPGS
ncbi:MAG TPA: GNAT family N-acetyltransferase [Streptosporangiaceae bacterium]|nr:GNAT family N-acetyltransferase [Streptosporangiaceae bacterium]